MFTSPLQVLSLWVRGLVAVAIIVASVWLWRAWYEGSQALSPVTTVRQDGAIDRVWTRRVAYRPGWNWQTACLAGAIATSLWTIGGGLWFERVRQATARGEDLGGETDDRAAREKLDHKRRGEGNEVAREDGSAIHVVVDGNGPTVVWTHGWGLDGSEWNVVRPVLAGRCEMVTWDLAGLGYTERPPMEDYSIGRMARDLRAVVEFAGDRPMVLVGHSIGGMAILEFCRRFPELLGPGRVAGVVLAHTTYTNPLRTMKRAWLYTRLQKPVIVPLLWASVALSPVLRVMAWLSYLNGSAHRSARRSGFSGHAPWEKLDFVARYEIKCKPRVLARGALGMIHWDGEVALGSVGVPALVVIGRRDPVTRPGAGDHIRANIPGADVLVLEEAKHQGVVEFNRAFARRVGEFVERCVGRKLGRHGARAEGTERPGMGRDEIDAKGRPEQVHGEEEPEVVSPDDWRDRDTIKD